jgi:hypothetical protein
MEVLERKDWCYIFDCKGCESKLKALRGDVKYGRFGGNAWENGTPQFYVSCCVCSETRIITEKKIPPDIADKARMDYARECAD